MQNKQTNNFSSQKNAGGLFATVAAVKLRKNAKLSRENKQDKEKKH